METLKVKSKSTLLELTDTVGGFPTNISLQYDKTGNILNGISGNLDVHAVTDSGFSYFSFTFQNGKLQVNFEASSGATTHTIIQDLNTICQEITNDPTVY